MNAFIEENQIVFYAIIIPLSILLGVYAPSFTLILEPFIPVVLGLLMYSMLSQIPFFQLKNALANRRYLISIIITNYMITPLIIFILLQFLPNNTGIIIGVLLVLLTPCIDYVIVFTKIGKGNAELVLASTPFLFITQFLLLPIYITFFMGKEFLYIIEIRPFVETFITLIVIPLLLTLCIQWFSLRFQPIQVIQNSSAWLPVPLMALTLLFIISSQIPKLLHSFNDILIVIPIFIVFMICAFIVAYLVGKLIKLDIPARRSLIFTTGTRNSLVVLPLALALPAELAIIASAVIVTQTIVELIGELIYIKIVPLIIR